MTYVNASPFPITTSGPVNGLTGVFIQRRDASTKLPSYCGAQFVGATGSYVTEYNASYVANVAHCAQTQQTWQTNVPDFVNRLRYLEGKATIESETITPTGFTSADLVGKRFKTVYVQSATSAAPANPTNDFDWIDFPNPGTGSLGHYKSTTTPANTTYGATTWSLGTDGVITYVNTASGSSVPEENKVTLLDKGLGFYKVSDILYDANQNSVLSTSYYYWFEIQK
jgi:hypothetical protein